MEMAIGKGSCDRALSESEVRELMEEALSRAGLDGKRVLIIVPDSTRTAPIPMMFRLFHELLSNRVAALDFLIALGTHQPMSEEAINRHFGVTAEERATRFANMHIFNHRGRMIFRAFDFDCATVFDRDEKRTGIWAIVRARAANDLTI